MKAVVLSLFFTIGLISSGYSHEVSIRDEADTEELSLRDSIIDYAQCQLGIPYVWGGTTTKGFDCTGFVYFVFKKFGIKVSRASSGYEGYEDHVDLAESRPGDIMLFTGTNSSIRKVGHAGIVLQNKEGVVDFIHSSSSKKHFGVTITRYNESGYVKRFLRVINVIK